MRPSEGPVRLLVVINTTKTPQTLPMSSTRPTKSTGTRRLDENKTDRKLKGRNSR